ncbi:MAG: MotA/TolQ/ExbB proton channel family protein [Phycisphaerales bacterium]|nr:MAG: MotA/TolQ/ExbB proton channel family protein [Phycisphaerales bacterium]
MWQCITIAAKAGTALALGAGDAAETAGQAAQNVQLQSVWDFAVKGGPMMVPIGICSLLALAVIVERLFSLRRERVIPKDFVPGLGKLLDQEAGDREKALDYCRSSGTPISSIFETAIKRLGEPIALLEKHIQDTGEREVLKLRKYLRLLAVIASIAPIMGLLGTIFGMINAFQTVASSGEALGRTELLAEGIYEAMITTAAGLMVAIPALLGYHGISAKTEHLVAEMDQMTVEFIEQYASTPGGIPAPATMLDADELPSGGMDGGDGRAITAHTAVASSAGMSAR